MKLEFVSDCGALRKLNPVILCIANPVAMNFNANALLSVGASPLMSCSAEEMRELTMLSSALYVNIGCPDRFVLEAARIAVRTASQAGRPWVLDPVGAGISGLRTGIVRELIGIAPPAIIRGNASEIKAVAGGTGGSTRGIDSSDDGAYVQEAARKLAADTGSVVVTSGATDYITDGRIVRRINNGDAMMSRVSGMGCTASALCAAFSAVDGDMMMAASCAMALMGVAGERTAAVAGGVGSFQTCMLDELGSFSPQEYSELIKSDCNEKL